MTRINAGIGPYELSGKMLLAEHREIKRVPNNIKKGKCKVVNLPIRFTLGSGHVRFFYNKLLYLERRYYLLYAECIRRKYKVTCYAESFKSLPKDLMGDYTETLEDRSIVIDRITENGGFLIHSKKGTENV